MIGCDTVNYPTLSNPPLVEVIFELHWQLDQERPQDEPYYGILAGTMFEKLRDEYPFHEPLPAAQVPADIVPHVVQHRFRKGENEWPLVQIGPGIVTLNYTREGFDRNTFHRSIKALVQTLRSIYEEDQKPTFNRLLLRYIDAVDFDFQANNISEYISRTLKVDLKPRTSLVEDTGVSPSPTALDSTFIFSCKKPHGQFRLRFGRGRMNERDVLRWETIVEIKGQDVPQNGNEIGAWVDDADELIHKVFFRMIEGELMERFR
ncbi:MAG: hypothetical protein DRH70_08140 [Candidatus Coatesbacteria bacterium]|nr:MAG: hypothetical protein DRH70_08140 [Candidatus Coatesbacteria bacterium]